MGAYGHRLMTEQYFRVSVYKCENLAKIELNVTDDKGELVKNAYYGIFSVSNDPLNPKDSMNYYYWGYITDGKALVENLDEGSYYMTIQAEGKIWDPVTGEMRGSEYYPYWFDGKYNFYEADQINIACGDTKSYDITLEKIPEPNYYKVSGKVTDKETKLEIAAAVVGFIGTDIKTKNSTYYETWVSKNGTYEIELPDNATYIAYAYNASYKNGDWWQDIYVPVYYDNTTDPAEAKELVLTADIDNINFELFKKKDYENTIYGIVKGTDDEKIGRGAVVAYLIEATDKENKIFEYSSQVSKIDDKGEFFFENNIPGKYILFAIADEITYIPGYYKEGEEAVLEWEDATLFTIGETGSFGAYTITLPLRKDGVRGNGEIRGSIGKKNKNMALSGDITSSDPLIGANIYALDKNGNIMDIQNSNENGSFTVTGLMNGEYTLIADKVGYSNFRATVNLDDNNKNTNLNIELVDEKPLDIDENNPNAVNVYPNPAVQSVAVEYNAANGLNKVELVNTNGETVMSETFNSSKGSTINILNLGNIPSGSYFIRITNDETVVTMPLAVTK